MRQVKSSGLCAECSSHLPPHYICSLLSLQHYSMAYKSLLGYYSPVCLASDHGAIPAVDGLNKL